MEKMARLEGILKDMGRVMVAYSGGVDSTLLLYVAGKLLGDDVVAATVVSPLLTEKEIEKAEKATRQLKIEHRMLNINIFSNKDIVSNPPQRCYHCKMTIFNILKEEASRLNINHVIDATQSQDMAEFRPGLLALMELGIRSPLAEAGFTKEDVRRFARIYNLPSAEAVPSPCLATRIPFGTPITMQALLRVAAAEDHLKSLGFMLCRVRDYHPVAVVEVPDTEIERTSSWPLRRDLTRHLKEIGYTYVAVDLDGYRKGSQMEVLKEREKKKKMI